MRVSALAPDTARARTGPAWAQWSELGQRYTLGLEEEVMLLDAVSLTPEPESDAVIERLSPRLARHASRETHTGMVELKTGVHGDVTAAVAELWSLRLGLADELRGTGVSPACAGIHPWAAIDDTRIAGSPRYRVIAETMRWLARREPTMGLHVHVGVPDPDDATRALQRVRESLPLLLALSANSPFCHGRDSGFASTRTVVLDGFPRSGPPRAFSSYAEFVSAVDALVASSAIPDPTFLWWDARLQPGLGTVEVRSMDAQSTVGEIMPLVALLQCLVRLELEQPTGTDPTPDEVLAENRFLAARDGLEARLIDSSSRRLTSARALLAELMDECRPHAAVLGCSEELERVHGLARLNGAARQHRWVRAGWGLDRVLRAQAQRFTAPAYAIPPLHLERR
jgi:glutamate---cysteine ligase / carboxylate-amine ligase